MPLIAVATPFVGAAVAAAAHRVSDTARDAVTMLTCALVLLAVFAMVPTAWAGGQIVLQLDAGFPVPFSFYADPLGVLMALVTAVLWLLSSVYAGPYMAHEGHSRLRYDMFSLFSLGGMLGIVLTGNLLTLFLFFELMAILSYLLVIHEESKAALRAGLKYLFMGIIGGLVLLSAIVATYAVAGTVDISGVGIAGLATHAWAPAIFWAYIFGFAVKAGMFPVHVWLPDAHPVAPSPASALLSGIMIKAGVYGMIRTVYAVFGRELMIGTAEITILFWLGIITMLFASAVAITQTEIKRLLAYSSVAQIGYMVLGISLLTSLGLQGAVLHLVNHALMKGTLFLAAGAIIVVTGLREISSLEGLGRKMPITMTCFTISALSMIGFPPFAGFISKWTLALGALQAPAENTMSTTMAGIAVGALLLSSLLNAVYYGPILVRGWFGSSRGEAGHGDAADDHSEPVVRTEAHWRMVIPMLLLSAGTIVFGVYPQPLFHLTQLIASAYFGG
jgi:multicomponent Na+:H+ antiporter subunit D